jgi:methyltransferase (TIGR00027 family)
MTLQKASVTMLAACAARAQHASLLGDLLSPRILGELPEAAEKQAFLDGPSRGMFSRSILVRTLHFKRRLAREAGTGAQLVILSHGLDFRPMSEGGDWSRIFAVDHPESQQLSRSVLGRLGLDLPVTFVPLDLAEAAPGDLGRALAGAGLDASRPVVVLWEGATYYLPPASVEAILAALPPLSCRVLVLADFLNEGGYFLDGKIASAGVERNLAFVASLGEPWVGFFDPSRLKVNLEGAGFTRVSCRDRAEVESDLLGEQRMHPNTMFFLEAQKGPQE